MTFDDFKSTVRARFPGMDFQYAATDIDFRAEHERCVVGFRTQQTIGPGPWGFLVRGIFGDNGDTLDAAIDAHQLRLQLINTNAQAMGLR